MTLAPFESNYAHGIEATGVGNVKHEKKEGLTKKEKVLTALAIAAFVGEIAGMSLGINRSVNNIKKYIHPTTTTAIETTQPSQISQTATTESITATTVTVEAIEAMPTVESLEIDGSLLSDPEALMKLWINKRTTDWFNAGATPENAQAALDSQNIPTYAAKIAEGYDKTFIDALLIKDWELNPVIVEWVNNMKLIHEQTLTLYFYTSFPNINPDDKAPYMRGSEYTQINSLIDNKDSSITIKTTEHDYDNADLNRVGEKLTGGVKVLGEESKPTRSFIIVDGKIKLSNCVFGIIDQ